MKQFSVKKVKKIKNNPINLKNLKNSQLLNNLFLSKAHYGFSVTDTNSKIFPYLQGKKYNQSIINLGLTVQSIKRTLFFIQYLLTAKDLKRQKILILCNNIYLKHLSKYFEFDSMSNFIEVVPSNHKKGLLTRGLTKYNLIILFSITNNAHLLNEAQTASIPLVALTDTNQNPGKINYPIVTNTTNIKTIFLFFYILRSFLLKVKL